MTSRLPLVKRSMLGRKNFEYQESVLDSLVCVVRVRLERSSDFDVNRSRSTEVFRVCRNDDRASLLFGSIGQFAGFVMDG